MEELVSAITMNSIAVNISRAIGPAAAGYLISATSEASGFLVNSACYTAFLVAVMRVVKHSELHGGAKESLGTAVIGGIRYMRRAKRFQAVMARGFSYFLAGSANIALLPVVARQELQVGAEDLGQFLGLIGIGAIFTAFIVAPFTSARYSRDQIVLVASLILAACLLSIGWTRNRTLFDITLFLYGGVWMTSMVALQVAAQMILPAWVRGRGLALASMSLSAGIAGGSIGWGFIAAHISIPATYTIACVTLTATAIWTYRYKISSNEPEDA